MLSKNNSVNPPNISARSELIFRLWWDVTMRLLQNLLYILYSLLPIRRFCSCWNVCHDSDVNLAINNRNRIYQITDAISVLDFTKKVITVICGTVFFVHCRLCCWRDSFLYVSFGSYMDWTELNCIYLATPSYWIHEPWEYTELF